MKRFRILLISMAFSFLTGLSVTSVADDTEIYSQQVIEITDITGGNLLFMLDNSGSMNNPMRDDNTGELLGHTRIDVLKKALLGMFENAHNVNVGLGRFASLIEKDQKPPVNAPIMFPIAFIDGNVNEIKGEVDDSIMDVSVPIIQSSDDAEQNLGTGKMKLDEPELQMIHITKEAEPEGIKLEKPIVISGDDAAEWSWPQKSPNKLTGNDSVIYLGTFPETTNPSFNRGDSWVGLRFTKLDIPQGADINFADVEFVSDDAYDNDLQINIYGAANDGVINEDPSGVSFGNRNFKNDQGSSDGYISGIGYSADKQNFPLTGAEVFWEFREGNENDQVLSKGARFQTPNIQTLIQEIIARPGWQSGNSLVLLFHKAPNSPANERGFYAFGTTEGKPPKLRVYWSLADTKMTSISGWKNSQFENNNMNAETIAANQTDFNEIRLGKHRQNRKSGAETVVGIRFQEISIPKEATITDAKITLTHQSSEWTDQDPNADSETLHLLIHGENSADSVKFSNTKKILGRSATDQFAVWQNVPSTNAGQQFTTPNLADILQEIIAQEDWEKGKSVSFFLKRCLKDQNSQCPDNSTAGFRRIVGTKDQILIDGVTRKKLIDRGQIDPAELDDDSLPKNLPKLEVNYFVGSSETANSDDPNEQKQIIGLRFEAVDIPQGAEVVSASISFVSGANTTGSTNLIIQAEDVNNAQVFTEEDNNISKRSLTSTKVNWNHIEPWKSGVTYTTPDLKNIVQEVVNRSDWCGGSGGLAFIISSDDDNPLRNARTYDDQPSVAPVLQAQFDFKNVTGNGCVNQNFSGQISADFDDAEEKLSGPEVGNVYLASSALELASRSSESRLVGLRFKNIPISQGAKIKQAQLILTAKANQDEETSLEIWGEKAGSATQFTNKERNLSQRPRTKRVIWQVEDAWKTGNTYRSPDLKEIIQEMVNQDSWDTYNYMALFIAGTGRRDVAAFRTTPTAAAQLRIQVEGYLGEGGQGDFLTVRRRLKNLVKQMKIPSSRTPLVDSLFESAQYYLGKKVDYGKSRHGRAKYLVSHPGSYTSGEIKRSPECDINLEPMAEACASEEILGPAKYISPIGNLGSGACQTHHIVLLTDGIANVNTSQDKIKQLIGKSSCDTSYTDPQNENSTVQVSNAEACGIDLAEFLKEEKNIIVHTIGFQLGNAWLNKYVISDGADQGKYVVRKDGVYYYWNGNLGDEFPKDRRVDLTQVDDYEVDQKETERNRKAVKFICRLASEGDGNSALDCPDRNFYVANTAEELTAAFESIKEKTVRESSSYAAPGVSISRFNNLFSNDKVYYALFKPSTSQLWNGNIKKYRLKNGQVVECDKDIPIITDKNQILDGTSSCWSSMDGGTVTKGGVGGQLLNNTERRIFTYLGDASPGTFHNINLTNYPIQISSDQGGTEEEQEAQQAFDDDLTQALFGNLDELSTAERNDLPNKRETLIRWILGQDGEGNPRWMFADPLHSSPRVITYGGSVEKPVIKLFVGSNDGLIRMIDDESGQEEWAFLPQELLPIQKRLMENQTGEGRLYGVDGTATFWINDQDTHINPLDGDLVMMYIGMRRGGRNLYAIDVTGNQGGVGKDEHQDPNWGWPPKLRWVIRGGEDNGFEKLGQTWSAPKVVTVHPSYCGATAKFCMALLFGGGFDPGLEDETSFNPTKKAKMGNGIYMVHAGTGKRLWWASDNNSNADLQLSEMEFPIPSDLAMLDSTGDGYTDRIYVGDVGGQLWRIDLLGKENNRGGVLAKVSDRYTEFDQGRTNRRSFFYPPQMITIEGIDIVTAVTGTRPKPLYQGNDVRDQFYVFRDGGWEQDGDNVKLNTLTQDDMIDVTDDLEAETIFTNPDHSKQGGWYLNLQGEMDAESGTKKVKEGKWTDDWIGEKGLAFPVIVETNTETKVYFTTYIPAQTMSTPCEPDDGNSLLYGLDLFSGKPVLDGERSKSVGGGLNSQIVTVISPPDEDEKEKNGSNKPGINIHVGIGDKQERDERDSVFPTFWRQQEVGDGPACQQP